jgi:cytochrome c-type biogenesis protein CcmH
VIFSLLLALLAFGAALPILAPLMRSNRPILTRASYDQAVYKDQLKELERDIARGLLTAAEAENARLEIQRRLLAADRLPTASVRLARSPILAAVLLAFVAGGGLAFYLWIGQPGVSDVPFAERKAELAQEDQQLPLRQAAERLAAKLKQNPSDADGWVLYGRSLALLGDWDKAEDAYSHAVALGRNGPDVAVARAEMLVMQTGGTITPAAETVFRDVLKADPSNPVARYYLAVALLQAGEPKHAIDGLQKLLAELPSNSPMRRQIGQTIAQAAQQAGIPTPALAQGTAPAASLDAQAAAGAAQMPNDRQMALIRGMVASLAAKQQADPLNLEGWLRLGRAYALLHELDKAADAYEQATALKPNDTFIQLQEAQALLSNQDPTARLTPRVLALLKRIEAADPNQPMVLWYLGLNAAQAAQPEQARHYWTTLLSRIPTGTQGAKMVQEALDALPKQSRNSGG